MLKIFLVEDEFVMREGIKNNVDWKAHGYDFCGEASDGELAFPLIQKLKPDIVITDIRMPFMDGLTLSRLIKKELPWIEIIILSGYEEFEYAKEAISIGVSKYLSKPVNGDDLLKEVDELAIRIEKEQQEREIREKYKKEMEEGLAKERKDFFQYLVTGSRSAAELLEMAGKMNMDISALWYNIVLIKVQSTHHAYDEFSDGLIRTEQKLEELADEAHLLVFDRNLEGKAFLFKADSQEELEELQNSYLDKMKEIFAGYEFIRYFGGIGSPVNRLGELPFSFEQASHAFAHRYLAEESMILNSDGMKQGNFLKQEEFQISSVDPEKLDRSKIQEFLRYGEKEETVYFVEEFFNDLGSNAMESGLFRQYITMDAYFCIADFLKRLQVGEEEIASLAFTPGVLQSRNSAMEYVIRVMKKALELREQSASDRYGDIVQKVMQYIEENYAEEELSLNLIASHVNFSPNYLSMIFSQQTGQTFSKYLTDYRMNRAKELLRCTGKRSSEISSEVGYKDPHYFSYLFKKSQGITPTEYRSGKNAEGERKTGEEK